MLGTGTGFSAEVTIVLLALSSIVSLFSGLSQLFRASLPVGWLEGGRGELEYVREGLVAGLALPTPVLLGDAGAAVDGGGGGVSDDSGGEGGGELEYVREGPVSGLALPTPVLLGCAGAGVDGGGGGVSDASSGEGGGGTQPLLGEDFTK